MKKIINFFNFPVKYRSIKFHNQLLVFLYANEMAQRKKDFEKIAELKHEVKALNKKLMKKYNIIKKLKEK